MPTSAPRKNGVAPGGLFCLRVNATATDIWPEHEVTERDPDGGLTARYLAGPKARSAHPLLQRQGTGRPLHRELHTGPCQRGCSAAGVSHPSPASGPMGSHLAQPQLTC